MEKENVGFVTDVSKTIVANGSHVCVGLDSDYEKLPEIVRQGKGLAEAIVSFNRAIVDSTHDVAAVYKLNCVFYAAYGIEGLEAMRQTVAYIHEKYPDMKVIADCKRSEMGYTAELAAKEIFEQFGFDAMIVTPWFGEDTISPYREYPGKAVIVLCHDSNPSAGQVQDLVLADGRKVYEQVTVLAGQWNTTGNVLMEGPLTYPDVLQRIVEIADADTFFLVAGLGAQGGNIDDLAIFKGRRNFVVNASRSVIFASSDADFAQAARKQVEEYNKLIADLLL